MTNLYLCAYRGRSVVSRAIRWFTWSDYSHVAIARQDGETWRTIEAWEGVGVRSVGLPIEGHTKGTPIELYEFRQALTQAETETLWAFLMAQLGDKYDYRGVASFILRRRMQRRGRWFCSELAAAACERSGRPLYLCEPWRVTPAMVTYSPVLRFVRRFS